MPVFTFEKISPPAREVVPPAPKMVLKPKPVGSRGLVGQMLDRLTVTRLKREQAKVPPGRKAG